MTDSGNLSDENLSSLMVKIIHCLLFNWHMLGAPQSIKYIQTHTCLHAHTHTHSLLEWMSKRIGLNFLYH